MHRIPVGVLGASGYAGRELCALIARHPHSSSRSRPPTSGAASAHGSADARSRFVAHRRRAACEAELVFSALPHGASAAWVERARSAGARVVDLSSDLRPGHTSARRSVRADRSRTRTQLRGADVVANPGCYPTAILLALVPLVAARADRGRRDASCRRRERRDRRGLTRPNRPAVRRGHRGLPRVRRRQRAPAPCRDAGGARGTRGRRRPRLHAAPAAGRARHPRDHHGAAHRASSTTRSRPGASTSRRAVRRDRPTSRRRCATSCGATSCGSRSGTSPDVRTPTLLVLVGDRQPGEGRGRAGGAERERRARARRSRWDCRHDARHQDRRARAERPAPRGGARATRRGVDDGLVVVHGGGDEVSALQRRSVTSPRFIGGRRVTTAADLEIVRMVLSGTANKRLVARSGSGRPRRRHLR